jgi:HK97 family phage portal protein
MAPPPGGIRASLAGMVARLTTPFRQKPGAPASSGTTVIGQQVNQGAFDQDFLPQGTSGSMFSPNRPLVPPEPERVRLWDYPVGYNTIYTPRSYEAVSFADLEALASVDLPRLCIETRKDQIEGLDWQIKPRDAKEATAEQQKRADALTDFWRAPNGHQPFASWLRKALENVLVYDAPAFEILRNRRGGIIGFDVVDGKTIKLLVDNTGRRPNAPAPAFEQIIHGRPWVLLTTDDMLYMPRNPRPGHNYGFSPVEQILTTINIVLRRQTMQLQHFTESNVPPGLLNAPDGWNPEQVKHFQEWFDSILAGNTANRTRLVWGPAGAKYQAFKEAPYKDMFDEWLARVVTYAFSLPPNAFVERVNRATAQTAQEAALEEGLGPLMGWVQRFIGHVIQTHLGHDDLEFAWSEQKELDPSEQGKILVGYVKDCIYTPNEARDALGLDPVDSGDELVYLNGTTPLTLESIINPPEPPLMPTGAPQPGGGASSGGAAPGGKPAKKEGPAAKGKSKSLYVSRRLKNTGELRKWAKTQGFASTLSPNDMHVTIAFSRNALDWDEVGDSFDEIRVPAQDGRSVEQLGDEGAVVIRFDSVELTKRWQQIKDAGASWDHPEYKPHITITYGGSPSDLAGVQPYSEELVFGPERFAEVAEDWNQKIEEKEVGKAAIATFPERQIAARRALPQHGVAAEARAAVDREALALLSRARATRGSADRSAHRSVG